MLCLNKATYSQQIQTESSVDVPILKVTGADHWARTPILQGQVLTWGNEVTATGFSFTPEVLGDGKTVKVKIERVEAMGKRVPLEELKLTIGAPAVTSTKSPYKIEIQAPLRVQTQATLKPVVYRAGDFEPAVSAGMFQNCCVTCGGIRVCANCSVSMDCGCCCTPSDRCCALCQ